MAVCLLGRPRRFDMDKALDAATIVFRELGYVGCSLSDLEKATGVSRMSLYNAIGDKEAIFLAVLERFTTGMAQHFGAQLPEKRLDEIIGLFTSLVEGKEQACCKEGCLVVTTSLERDQMSDAIRTELLRTRERQVAMFQEILAAEKERGVLAPDIDPAQGAAFIVNAYWGGAATVRLYDDMEPMRGPIMMLIRTLKSWKA
ncbi:MAG: TetR/AcrR family transcriptional regulator [Pseudomonadota bacterium]